MTDFNETLKNFRKLKRLTQAELGKRVGVSSQVISNWERGYTTGISVEMLNSLANALDISSEYLLGSSKSWNGTNDYSDFFYDDDFQDRVKKIMNDENISFEELLQKTDISKELLQEYLYSRRQPSFEDLIKISNAINTSIDYLLDNSQRKRLANEEELLLSSFAKCNQECREYLIAKAGVLSVEGLSAVAAAEYERYLDDRGKSLA